MGRKKREKEEYVWRKDRYGEGAGDLLSQKRMNGVTPVIVERLNLDDRQ